MRTDEERGKFTEHNVRKIHPPYRLVNFPFFVMKPCLFMKARALALVRRILAPALRIASISSRACLAVILGYIGVTVPIKHSVLLYRNRNWVSLGGFYSTSRP